MPRDPERPAPDLNEEEASAVHERWMRRRNRKQEAPDYRDEWWSQQCGMCAF
jgi:hypothetical protein